MGIGEYVAEFERLDNRAKAYDMLFLEAIFADKFQNNASITNSDKKLIPSTLTELSYDTIKHQLKKCLEI